MQLNQYSSLHNHTDGSNTRLLDCIIKTEKLIEYSHDIGLNAVAITDHANVCNHIKAQKFLSKKRKNDKNWNDFKVILGNEIYLTRNGLSNDNFIKGEDSFYHFILLAKDKEGHKQIRQLSTRAFQRAWYKNMVRVPNYYQDIIDIIGANPGHVWMSTACLGGYLPTLILKEEKQKADNFIQWCKKISGNNFSLELQPSLQEEQIIVNKALIELAEKHDVPYIITTDAHYLHKEDRKIHEAFLNSKGGERETADFYATTYIMTPEQIHECMDDFIGYDAVEKGLQNTNLISEQCSEYSLLKKTELPYIPFSILEPSKKDLDYVEKYKLFYLKKFLMSKEQADRQLGCKVLCFIQEHSDANQARIENELETTWNSSEKMEMVWSKYFLQMADYINILWTTGDTLVGPSRGSGTGFYLNYILGITQIDPTKENVDTKSWRFLNPERASLLDIDTDIQGTRRSKCISALKDVYGEYKVIPVVTFGTEKAKSAIKTAARGLGINDDIATYLSSFIGAERGIQYTLSQTFYGDEENGIKPNRQFVELMTYKYPNVWAVAQEIEGLISHLGVHAGGVIITDKDIDESASLMKTNNDELVTCYDLHDAEDVGLIKIDLLAIEALDRMRACLDLLVQYDYLPKNKPLREIYEQAIGIYNLERSDPKMWEMVSNHDIISLFQMEQSSGIQGIALTKPECVEDLTTINSVMRLMASEKGAEQPLNKYARFKTDPTLWELEMREAGLTEEERQIIRKQLGYEYGICAHQEDIMTLVQQPEIGGFSLLWADKLRKSVAKKNPKDFEALRIEFFKNMEDKKLSYNLCHYVWDVLINTQKGYSFCLGHTLAYSLIGLQEMNLAYKFPIIFWNTANIITDSKANDLIGKEQEENDEDEDEEDKKNSIVNYGKMAKAIGNMKAAGVKIHLPNINKSSYTFAPNVEENTIYYGIKGITKINNDIAEQIINNRPYSSVEDFLSKVRLNKPQMINLIKSGAFIDFGSSEDIMKKYIASISDQKKDLNLRNMQMLINKELLPNTFEHEIKIFNFNKYLKKFKEGDYYLVDTVAYKFYEEFFDTGLLDYNEKSDSNIIARIYQKDWNKIYSKKMDIIRDYIKENKSELLQKLNSSLSQEMWNKYALGNQSKWEMDSVSYYDHEHELANVNTQIYEISDFNLMSEEPEVENSFVTEQGYQVNINRIYRIMGTVLDKDKAKHTVTLLTPTGVVTLKIWGSQYSKYDKQVSEILPTGKKKVIEKSWFSRGNKLLITGMRRGDAFIPKVYKKTKWQEPILLIDKINDDGSIEVKKERMNG